jgi:hypothetical protein
MDISSNQSESYSPFLLDDSGNMVLDASGIPIFIPQPLVYPDISGVDLSGYTNMLLINSAVADYQDFVTYANSETFPVVFSIYSTREELLALVSGFSNLSRIGLVFETNDNGRVYGFLNMEEWFMDSDLEGVDFSPNMQFMISLIQTLGITNIDYLACNTLVFNNWKSYYAILTDKTGVVVGASDDKTGNIKYGGDWVLESTGEDVEKVYFTSGIEYHSYLLQNAYVYGNTINDTTTTFTTSGNSIDTTVNKVIYQINANVTNFNNNYILLGGGGTGGTSTTPTGNDGAHALQIESTKIVTHLRNNGSLTGGGAGAAFGGGGKGSNGGAGGGGAGGNGNNSSKGGNGGGGSSKNGFNGESVGASGGGGGFNGNGGANDTGIGGGLPGTNATGTSGGGGGGANATKIFGGNSVNAVNSGGGGAGAGNSIYPSAGAGGGGGSGGGIGDGYRLQKGGYGGFGIKNNGTITNLYNSQNLSGNYGPLYIAGTAPTNYYITILGDTSYGQLFASPNGNLTNGLNLSGSINFNIDPSSILTVGTKKYTNVLSDVNVNVNTISGTGTFNRQNYKWTLSRNLTWIKDNNLNTVINYDLSLNIASLQISITLKSSPTNSKLVIDSNGNTFSPFDVSSGTTDISLSYVKQDISAILDLSVNNISYRNIASPFDISRNLISGDNSLNLTIYSSDRTSSQAYFVKVRVPKSNKFKNLFLNKKLVTFDSNFNANMEISYNNNFGISGDYYTIDTGCKVDLSVNNMYYTASNIDPSFNVPLKTRDNSLNFMVTSSENISQPYFVKVYMQTSNKLSTLYLNNQLITFDTSFNGYLDISNGIDDISGSYYFVDPSANVDLSVNGLGYRNIGVSFDVPLLVTGDNSLNFVVNAWDGKSKQPYFVKVRVQKSNKFSNLYLSKQLITFDTSFNANVEVSYNSFGISGDYYTVDTGCKVDLSVNNTYYTARNIDPSFNVPLNPRDNSLNFMVRSADNTSQAYFVKVYMQTSNKISTLYLYNKKITFDTNYNGYLDVSYGISDISGSYYLVDPSANVDLSVNGFGTYGISVSFDVPLLVRGDNSLNFVVNAWDGKSSQPYAVTVHVQTANKFSTLYLYNQPVTFDASFNASLDVSYGIDDISGSYYLLDPSANVDLSVNGMGNRNIGVSFDVPGLVRVDNSLNFTVNAYDGQTKQPYFVKLHVQTANTFKTLFLNKTLIDISNTNIRLDISYGISSISGDYYLTDPSAKVDLSVNTASQYAIGPSFNVIDLGSGDNSLNFTVTASDKKTVKTYPINVHVKTSADFSGNAITLYNRTVTFNASGLAILDVSYGLNDISGGYVLVDPSANVDLSINGFGTYGIGASFDVSGLIRGDNSLNFMVTAKDGLTQRPYAVTVHVQTAKDFSGNVITLYNQPVFFDASYNAYLDISFGVYDVSGVYELVDPSANVDLSLNNGLRFQRGMLSPFDVSGLVPGDNSLNFMVTAYDSQTQQGYFLKVHMQTANSIQTLFLNNRLIDLDVVEGLRLDISNGISDISGSYVLVDPSANVDVSVNLTYSAYSVDASFNVPTLVMGDNSLNLKVTAYDGQTFKNYPINVHVQTSVDFSLNRVTLYGQPVVFDVNGVATSQVDVSFGVSDICGGYLLVDPSANVDLSVNGVGYPDISDVFDVPGLVRGDNSLNFLVSAYDGQTFKSYSVTVHVQTSDKFVGNAISFYQQPVVFDASFNAYLDISYGVYDVSGGYELVDPSANVDLSVNGVGVRNIGVSFDVPDLRSGDNSLNFLVSAWDGQTQQGYFLKVHMQTANSIQTLFLNNRLIDLDVVEGLRLDISNGISDISGSYVLVDPSANVDVSVNLTYSAYSVDASFNVPTLVMGDNSLNLKVTAYDGQTFRNYPINVHVQTSVDFSLNRVVLYGKPVVFDVNGVATSQVDVSFGVSDICGGFLLVDPSANVDLSVNGVGYPDISDVFDVPGLVRGDNSLNLLVSAYDGQTFKAYSVTVHVQTSDKFVGNAISFYQQPVVFDASFNAYLDISYGVYDVSGGYELVDPSANVDLSVNGVGYRNIGVSFDVPDLRSGDNSLNFLVSAYDGQTQQGYFLKVHMQTANSIQTLFLNNRLIDLDVVEGLRLDISNGISDISGSYVLVDPSANVDVSVNLTYSAYSVDASFNVPTLVMGDNSLNLKVTAYDGQTFRNYPINVHVQTSVDFSLNRVTLYGQPVVFDVNGVALGVVDVSFGVSDICGGYLLVDPSANVDLSVNGVGYLDISGVFNVPGLVRGDNSLNFLVSAYDGQTSREYSVNVHVQTANKFVGNAISLYKQPIQFDASFNAYLDISYGVYDISGGYSLVDPSANVDLSVNGLGYRNIGVSFDVPDLRSGDNSLNFLVRAWDGQTQQPYFVKLHMQTANSIQTLFLNNRLIDLDEGLRIDVSNGLSDISGSYYLVDPSANVDISVNLTYSAYSVDASFDVPTLVMGDNSLNLTVTAYDGQTVRVYPINVHVQTSIDFSGNRVTLYGKPVTFDVNGISLGVVDVSYGIGDISGEYLLVDSSANVKLTVGSGPQNNINTAFNAPGLVRGDNSLNFLVSAADGQTSRVYVAKVHVQTANKFLGNEITLNNQSVNFDASFISSLDIPYGITDISGQYVLLDASANVDLSLNGGVGYRNIDASFNVVGLLPEDNSLNFVVNAYDGQTSQPYFVKLHVKTSNKFYNNVITLYNQTVNFGNGFTGFIYIDAGISDISGQYVLVDPRASVDLSINGVGVRNIGVSFDVPGLQVGNNDLSFCVKPYDGRAQQTYYVNAFVKSSSQMTVVLDSKNISFDASNNGYVDIPSGVSDISGVYFLNDPGATVDLSINNVFYQYHISSQFNVPGLVRGDNSLNFLVTSADGLTLEPYFVKVHVLTSNVIQTLFLNQRLIDLGLGNLRIDISNGLSDISGSYYLVDPSANVDISVNLTYSKNNIDVSFDVPELVMGDNSLNLTVTGYDKKTVRVYPINVHVQTSIDFSLNRVVLYGQPVVFDLNGVALSVVDVSFGLSDICGGYLLVDSSANVKLSVGSGSQNDIGTAFNVPGLVRGDNSLNFLVSAYDGQTFKNYSVTVHVQTANKFVGNAISLYKQPVFFDASFNAYLDISYGVYDVSGGYELVDPSANVDLSVNGVGVRNIGVLFDVSDLRSGDNSLNFVVNAFDGQTRQGYFVKLHMQTSNSIQTLFLYNRLIDLEVIEGLRLDISNGISDISGSYVLVDPSANVDVSVNLTYSAYSVDASFNVPELFMGDNSLNLKVTAYDGQTFRNYPINVHVQTSVDFSLNRVVLYGKPVVFDLNGLATSQVDVSFGVSDICGGYLLVDPSANVDLSVNGVGYSSINTAFNVPGLVRGDNSLNFLVSAYDGQTSKNYSVTVHVQTANKFVGNAISLYRQPVVFDASFNAYLDISYGVYDVSGGYALVDPSANVDLSVNGVGYRNIGVLFDVPLLVSGDNSLNFVVSAWDGQTSQGYFVKLHMQTSNSIQTLFLNNRLIDLDVIEGLRVDVSNGLSDISGSYVLVDPSANVDISVNQTYSAYSVDASFDVPSLVMGDNSLNLTVTAYDGQTFRNYPINVHVQTSVDFSGNLVTLYGKPVVFDLDGVATSQVDVSFGVSDISGGYLLVDPSANVDLSVNGVGYRNISGVFDVPGLVRGDNSLNFLVSAYDGQTSRAYVVNVHVQTANKFLGNAISLYRQPVFFDASFNAYLDISYGVYDVSGGYALVDPSANVDLSVNGVGYRNIGVSFDVPLLVSGDNSLNFLVRAWDGQTQQPYFVKLHMQTSNSIQTLFLYNKFINLENGLGNLRIDISNGLNDISGSYYLVDPRATVDLSVNGGVGVRNIGVSFDVPSLVMGDNSLNLTVTAYDKQTTRVYPINVHVQTSVDFSSNLMTLYGKSVTFGVNGVALSQVDVSFGVSDISGGYVLVDSRANVDLSVNGVGYTDIPGVFNVPGLVRGDNSLNFLVSAYDGQTSRGYSVTVHVQTANKFVGNAISLYRQPVFFDASFNAYLDISYGVYDVSGGYALVDPSANVDLSVNGLGYKNIGVSFDVPSLVMGDNSLNFLVNAYDGQTKQGYFVKLHMQTANSIQTLFLYNKLINLGNGLGNLRIDVSNGLNDISGSYYLVDPRASVDLSVNGGVGVRNIGVSFDVPGLLMGDNSLNLTVTAYDKQTVRSYPINVHVQTSVDFSGNRVTLYGRPVTFAANGVALSQVDISNGVSDISGGYVLVDPSANVKLSVGSGSQNNIGTAFAVSGLNVGDNSLNFLVSAADGQTSRAYVVNAHIQTSNKFSSVTLNNQPITFDGNYNAKIDVSNELLDISGTYITVGGPGTRVDLSVNNVYYSNAIASPFNVPLGLTDNSLNFLVTASDGMTSQRYTVSVHVKTSNKIKTLFLNNQLVDVSVGFRGFLNVPIGVNDISGSYYTVGGLGTRVDLSVNNIYYQYAIGPSFDVPLGLTDNSLNFLVTASDGLSRQAYVVSVHVETSDKMSVSLDNQNVVFDASNNGRINVDSDKTDISGTYYLTDGGANVDLSVNSVTYIPNLLSPFTVTGLLMGDNSLNFLVTSSDGLNTEEYFVNVHLKTSVGLSLNLNGKAIGFVNYLATLDVSGGTTSVPGIYSLTDPSAKIDLSVNGLSVPPISPNFTVNNLQIGDNSLNFVVTASDGLSRQAYFVKLRVPTSSKMRTLVLNNQILDVSNGNFFTINTATGTTDISGSYSLYDLNAKVDLSVNGISRTNIPTSFNVSKLLAGDNSLNFMVKASDGLFKTPYYVTVHVNKSSKFKNLYLKGSLVLFDASYNSSINLVSGTNDLSGNFVTVDPACRVDLSLNSVSYPSLSSPFQVPLVSGDNSLNFTLTASDNASSQKYTVNAYVAKSQYFQSLTLFGQTFTFSDGNYNAFIDIEYELMDISGSYVTEDPDATVNLYVNSRPYPNLPDTFDVSLNQANNLLSFTVFSSDGVFSQTYYVNILLKIGCLLEGTLVLTERGYVPIETLKVGDSVRTQNYLIAITKIGKWSVDLNTEKDRDDLSKKMYVIPEGRYGAQRDVFISRNHRFMFEEGDGAGRLMGTPVNVGLRPAVLGEFAQDGKYTLYHLELKYGNHFVVNGGCHVESWTPGKVI